MSTHITIKGFSKRQDDPLAETRPADEIPLPPPFDKAEDTPAFTPLKDKAKEAYELLDSTIALSIPRPESKKQEEELVNKFLDGLRKCFSEDDNWTFLQPLVMSMEHCAKCQTCNEACPIYEESGHFDMYRPTFRSGIIRRIYWKYIR